MKLIVLFALLTFAGSAHADQVSDDIAQAITSYRADIKSHSKTATSQARLTMLLDLQKNHKDNAKGIREEIANLEQQRGQLVSERAELQRESREASNDPQRKDEVDGLAEQIDENLDQIHGVEEQIDFLKHFLPRPISR